MTYKLKNPLEINAPFFTFHFSRQLDHAIRGKPDPSARGTKTGRFGLLAAQPVQARIDALETLRQQHHQGQQHVDTGLQRVCRITQLKRR